MTAQELLDWASKLIEKHGANYPVHIPIVITGECLSDDGFDHPPEALRDAVDRRSRDGAITSTMCEAFWREHDVLRELADHYVAANTPRRVTIGDDYEPREDVDGYPLPS